MKTLPRTLLILAALLALGASLYIFIFGGGTLVTETAVLGEDQTPLQTIERISWFRAQGWWGIIILVIFADLYFAPLFFYLRGRTGIAALFGVAAITLSLLAGFSIGLAYFPAAGALLLALPAHLLSPKN